MKQKKSSPENAATTPPRQSPGAIQYDTYTGRVGDLLSVASTCRLTSPPRRAFRANEDDAEGGPAVYEDLVLVGWIAAPRSVRESLELYGIDMSCAKHNSLEGRWEGCILSEPVADMLVELIAEGEFPYAFEVLPSWAELEWRVRQLRGEVQRPELEVYMFTEPASLEAVEAFRKRTGANLVRRGVPQKQTEDPTGEKGHPPSLGRTRESRKREQK